MGLFDESRFVERIKFFDGQRLFADDLQGLEAFNQEMRRLHNQSLHQPGIGRGYAVSGEKGSRQVTIEPGYAIDADGREIVLTQTQTIQVPPVSTDEKGRSVFFDLTVAYQETDLEEVEFRDGLCDTRGAIRLREAPVFCWVRLQQDDTGNLHPTTRFVKDLQEGRKIILARVEVLNCQLQQVVSIVQRQSALPECGPHIGCGTADPTLWAEVDLDDPNQNLGPVIILQAEIDTQSAGFQMTPCYSALIPGSRIITLETGDIEAVQVFTVFLLDFLRIQDPQPDKFTAFLLVGFTGVETKGAVGLNIENLREAGAPEAAAATQDPRIQKLTDWIKQNWHVTWMGVEG
jgi:hypothetical protein